MKTKLLLLAAIVGLGATGAVRAAVDPSTDARVQVTFDHPDKFTDVRDSYMPSDKGRDGLLDMIKLFVQERAVQYLPADQKLAVTFTDIDMAGDFEPWRSHGTDDVRIVKDIYPPRIDLHYTVTDASGKVVKEGKRELRDLAFLMKLSIRRNDSLRYEKELLDDWLRADIKPSVAKS